MEKLLTLDHNSLLKHFFLKCFWQFEGFEIHMLFKEEDR